MQNNETISRRPLDVEDYVDVVRRHKGWIMGPFLFALVASVVGAYLWPDTYVSQAVVKIVPQQVPQNMVQSAINQEMTDRINSMSQTILSRTVLTTIVNTFNLYARDRARRPIEDVIEDMRKKIELQPVASVAGGGGRQVPAFVVQFSYENRYTAQKVVQDLVSRFIDENIRNRSNATFQTTQFIKDQYDSAKKDLDDVESRVAAFRTSNNGRLPDQMDSNFRQLNALQSNITMLSSNVSRAQQDKLQLESNLRILQDQLNTLTREPVQGMAGAQQKSDRLAEVERDIQNWEGQLNVLRQHYKDTYPDVQIALGRLQAAEKRREQMLKEEVAPKADAAPSVASMAFNVQAIRDARELEAGIRRFEAAIEAKQIEVDSDTKELKRANDMIKTIQSRIDSLPQGEKQYADLMQQRDLARQKYVQLDEKLSRAQIAQDMEGRKQGETLELLDPASLPQTPTEPRRPLIISLGAVAGLVLGMVFAGFREVKDTSLKNLKDVRAYSQMTVLASVPILEHDYVVQSRKRAAWLGWTAATVASAVVIAGTLFYYYTTKV